jgi:hypothetical protein
MEKLKNSQWINGLLMKFEENHREECNCFELPIKKLLEKVDFKTIITFHNLEDLYKEYADIKKSPEKLQKVLNLESIKSLSKSLRMT